MTRLEIRTAFRNENPEVTTNVILDATLNDWLLKANREICAATFCILSNATPSFNSVINQQYYDLELNISQFYSINDMPGGGVFYDNLPLRKVTPGEMNVIRKSWKTSDAGIPRRYWRQGKYLWFDVKPVAIKSIGVDSYLIPDDFNDDSKTPFNQLGHLVPFHDSLSKYLQWRCKEKIGKDDEGARAKQSYLDYVKWMKSQCKSSNQQSVFMRPSSSNSGIPRY